MADNTKIEWADASANAWWGCTKYGPGCTNCYALTLAKRYGFDIWGKDKPRKMIAGFIPAMLRLNRKAEKSGNKLIVFVNSMSDFFEEHDGQVRDQDANILPLTLNDLRRDSFKVFDKCQWLKFLLLTKRPENIRKMWVNPNLCRDDIGGDGQTQCAWRENVWLGTSISNQNDADKAIPELLKCRDYSPVLFLSLEPLISGINIQQWLPAHHGRSEQFLDGTNGPSIDWIIVGGESGKNSRVNRVEWVRSVVSQCKAASVPCFVKQMGQNVIERNDCLSGDGPDDWHENTEAIDNPNGWHDTFQGADVRLRLIDKKGGNPDEWPEALRLRQFPSS